MFTPEPHRLLVHLAAGALDCSCDEAGRCIVCHAQIFLPPQVPTEQPLDCVHIVPMLDVVQHTLVDCVCGPEYVLVEGEQPTYRHHTLDQTYTYTRDPDEAP